jgi:hypothetical protein
MARKSRSFEPPGMVLVSRRRVPVQTHKVFGKGNWL